MLHVINIQYTDAPLQVHRRAIHESHVLYFSKWALQRATTHGLTGTRPSSLPDVVGPRTSIALDPCQLRTETHSIMNIVLSLLVLHGRWSITIATRHTTLLPPGVLNGRHFNVIEKL